jgi:peptidoglycan/xylan/chitin deacetylase (PgdA/CDA1 family)
MGNAHLSLVFERELLRIQTGARGHSGNHMKTEVTRRDFLKTCGAAAVLLTSFPRYGYAAATKVPVLLYHDISDQFSDAYTISPALFAAQMEWLYANGFRALSLHDVDFSKQEGRENVVVITFDDGYASFMEYAFPFLSEYGFKATINIIGKYVGTFLHYGGNRPMLSWDEYRYLNASGLIDLGCHTQELHTSGGVTNFPKNALKEDLRVFIEGFHAEIGSDVDILAWPYGAYDKKSMRVAEEAGFTYLLTSREERMSEDTRSNEIPRLNINEQLDLVSFEQYIGGL